MSKSLKTKYKGWFIDFILIIFGMLTLVSCEDYNGVPGADDPSHVDTMISNNYQVVVIEGCEYIVYQKTWANWGYSFMAHKGNCKNHADPTVDELKNQILILNKKLENCE